MEKIKINFFLIRVSSDARLMISTSARRLLLQTDACFKTNGLGWFSGGAADVISHYDTLYSRFDTRSSHIITQPDGKGDSTVVVEISGKTKGVFHFDIYRIVHHVANYILFEISN